MNPTRSLALVKTWTLAFLLVWGQRLLADRVEADGRFGQSLRGLQAGEASPVAKPHSAYHGSPLTVECWAKLRSKAGFNILLASNVKSSTTAPIASNRAW